ncbi:MAG TPA: RelA/SpoT domain-containing protein, partial [Capillimicrobium sp.]|nr:RelA/SpoT domain-containing protein [Capillimicrobium sp.]
MVIEAAYSRKQVNRAGHLLCQLRRALICNDETALADLHGSKIDEAIQAVEWWRARHARPLARVNANLRYYIRKAGVADPEVTQRLKRFSTIVHKLDRESNMQLSRMEDIGGVRAILPSQHHVDHVVDLLGRAPRWRIRRLRRYVDGCEPGPKADGYRAVHVIVEKDGCFIEIQLRTPWQDVWAQSVEQDTRRLRAALKFGAGPDDLRAYYAAVSELFAMREANLELGEEFMADLAKLYAATRRYFEEGS